MRHDGIMTTVAIMPRRAQLLHVQGLCTDTLEPRVGLAKQIYRLVCSLYRLVCMIFQINLIALLEFVDSTIRNLGLSF
jgi:hypothetical protein